MKEYPKDSNDFLEKKWEYIVDKQKDRPCLHDACEGCKNGTCSGVHGISCPCPKCSPYC